MHARKMEDVPVVPRPRPPYLWLCWDKKADLGYAVSIANLVEHLATERGAGVRERGGGHGVTMRHPTLQRPDCLPLTGRTDGRQLQDEVAARPVAEDDVAAAGPGETARER